MPKRQDATTEQSIDAQGVIVIEEERLRESFTQIPNTILRRPDITPGAKLTYVMLLSYAWQKDSCFPGQATLAGDMGAGERSVIRYLKELQEKALLRVKRRGLGLTNIYTITRWGDSRSANLADPEVPKATGLEVPKRQTNKTQTEIDSTTHKQIRSGSMDISTLQRTSKRRGGRGENQTVDVYAQQIAQPVQEPDSRGRSDPTPVAEILARRPVRAGRSRSTQAAPYVAQLLTDFSSELHDEEHTPSNISQAMHLYRASGLDESAFVARLYEARSITKQRGNISKNATGFGLPGLRNKMPYYFAVLRDLLGLREDSPSGRESHATP